MSSLSISDTDDLKQSVCLWDLAFARDTENSEEHDHGAATWVREESRSVTCLRGMGFQKHEPAANQKGPETPLTYPTRVEPSIAVLQSHDYRQMTSVSKVSSCKKQGSEVTNRNNGRRCEAGGNGTICCHKPSCVSNVKLCMATLLPVGLTSLFSHCPLPLSFSGVWL